MLPFSLPALLRAVSIWLLIILAESVQGAARRLLVDPDVEFAVRQLSVLTGALVIFAITWVCLRWMRLRTAGEALGVGGLWVALTLLFEVGVGRLMGLGWDRMLADYDLLHGGLMPLGLLAMALTPWLVRRLQARRPSELDLKAGPPAERQAATSEAPYETRHHPRSSGPQEPQCGDRQDLCARRRTAGA